jgi:hypothetical protein
MCFSNLVRDRLTVDGGTLRCLAAAVIVPSTAAMANTFTSFKSN